MAGCKQQLMISYNWDSQKDVLKLREALTGYGYNVWIDIERMHENIYERMAEAVKESSIILLCMTKKYEKSKNCNREFQFAEQLRKRIIPIYFEKNYTADGPLALIISGKRYFDLRNKGNFDSEILKLKEEVDEQLEELGTDLIVFLQTFI